MPPLDAALDVTRVICATPDVADFAGYEAVRLFREHPRPIAETLMSRAVARDEGVPRVACSDPEVIARAQALVDLATVTSLARVIYVASRDGLDQSNAALIAAGYSPTILLRHGARARLLAQEIADNRRPIPTLSHEVTP